MTVTRFKGVFVKTQTTTFESTLTISSHRLTLNQLEAQMNPDLGHQL